MFGRTYRSAREADSAWSLAGWGWRAAELLFPTATGGLVMLAASYRDWIWNDYGMLGVLGLGIAAAAIMGLALFLTSVAISIFRKSRPADAAAKSTSNQTPAPTLPLIAEQPEFFVSRSALVREHGTLADRFANVSSVLAIFVTAQDFLNDDEKLGSLEKLLLPRPTRPGIKYLGETVGQQTETLEAIRSATKRALEKGIKVRWYDHFIFQSIILADTDKPSGWVHIELVLPYSRRNYRPSLTVTKRCSEEACHEMRRVFDVMWENASDAKL